jgi:hypothetical protein
VTPYVLPRDDELVLFLCRFEREEALRVALPADASAEERKLLTLALAAWSGAGLGVSLEAVEEGEPADISIRIGGAAEGFAAQTGADCGLVAGADSGGPVLDARLVSAHVLLRRADRDVRRHRVPLSPDEFLGSALHELGHALGFQGHVRRGSSIMVRNVEEVRRRGRRLLDGEGFYDATLAALYRVESGVVLARRSLPPGRTEPVDRLLSIGTAQGFTGPFLRVGDRSGRLAWWDPDGRRLVVGLPDLPRVLERPEALALVPGPVARGWLRSPRGSRGARLSPGSDRAPGLGRAMPPPRSHPGP